MIVVKVTHPFESRDFLKPEAKPKAMAESLSERQTRGVPAPLRQALSQVPFVQPALNPDVTIHEAAVGAQRLGGHHRPARAIL